MIQLFSPTLGKDELLSVADSFNTGWIGKGAKVAEFEAAWARHIGVNPENVASVNCATEGLFQVFKTLDNQSTVNKWAKVIIPSIHFIGAAQAILNARFDMSFCDVDRHTLNPTLEHIQAKYNKKHTKAVCLLHYGGVAQELDAIRQWCNDKHLWLIEDAACSPATTYKGKAAGTWGHFGVWSFDAMKVMSTGDGGMIYCENPEHANELRRRLYLGMAQESGLSNPGERWWEFEVKGLGRRAVMNDIAAGIGLEQLKRLRDFCYRRATIWDYYSIGLDNLPDVDLPPKYYGRPSYYFYWIQTPRRDDLAKFLRANDIYVSFRYYPLHWAYKTGDNLPNAEQAARETLLLPLHCNLTDEQVSYICEKVREFFNGSTW